MSFPTRRDAVFGLTAVSATALLPTVATGQSTRQTAGQISDPLVAMEGEVLVPPLIGVEGLKKLIEKGTPQIVDIRSANARRWNFSYASGHIPGAINVPYSNFRKLWSDPLSTPSNAAFEELVQSMGLTKDDPVVLVHSSAARGNFGFATFAYWTLKTAGITNMSILNGGISAWKAAGGDMSKVPADITRSNTQIVINDKWLATHEDVDAVLDGTSTAQLLDARPLHQIMQNASLEGSFILNAEDLIEGKNGQAGDDFSIFLKIKQAGLNWEYDEVITYCNSGALATVDWFMANEIAGISNVKVYGHSLKARRQAEKRR